MAELAQAFDEASQTLNSLDTHFTTTWETATSGAERTDWLWVSSGSKKLFGMNALPTGAGIAVPHCWWSFDGEHAYSCVVDLMDPTRIVRITRSELIDEMYEKMPNPGHFLGRPIYSTRLQLSELLRGKSVVLRGEEEVLGHRCWRIDFPSVETVAGKEKSLTVWLGCERPYPLTKWFTRAGDVSEEVARSGGGKNYTIVEIRRFQKIKDIVLNEDRIFPAEAVMIGTNGVQRYSFDKVELNHPIDRARFIPKPQVGTEMVLDEPGKPRAVTIHGGPAAIRARNDKILEDGKRAEQRLLEASQSNPPSVSALPVARAWVWWVLGGISGAGLALSYWISARRSK